MNEFEGMSIVLLYGVLEVGKELFDMELYA